VSPEGDDPVKFPTLLAVEDEDTLRIGATNGYGAPGETVRYMRDDAGRVARVIIGGVSSYPLEVYRDRTRERA